MTEVISNTGLNFKHQTSNVEPQLSNMNLDKESFITKINGAETSIYFLQNRDMQVAITNYGARIVSIIVNDKKGKPVDVVVGFDSIKGYLDATETFHGTIVGRYANRIANGKFSLEGKEYQLSINNPPNHLHGGPKGFHNQVWKVESVSKTDLRLSYFYQIKYNEPLHSDFPDNFLLHLLKNRIV